MSNTSLTGPLSELKAMRLELEERAKRHQQDLTITRAINATIDRIDEAIDEKVTALVKDSIKL